MNVTLALFELGSLLLLMTGARLFGSDGENWAHPGWRLSQTLTPALFCGVSYYYSDLYDLHVVRSFRDFGARFLRVLVALCLFLVALYTLFPATAIIGQPLASTFAVALLLVGSSVPIRWAVYTAFDHYVPPERVVIIGRGHLAVELIQAIESLPHLHYRVVGVVDDRLTEAPSGPGVAWSDPMRVPLPLVRSLVDKVQPDRIIVALSERRGRLPVRELLDFRGRGVAVEDGLQVFERLTGKIAIELLKPSELVFSKDFVQSKFDAAAKRITGIVVSALGMVIGAPLMALIALAIRMDSKGPVFFVQKRVGRYGEHFWLVKFRTMFPVAEAKSEWERDNDERITRVGRVLRRFRLDELPQLWNVLRGEMSLVGPRPHPMSNYALFVERIPFYRMRGMVRPGITGWAQVHYGYANNLEEETEKMRYDLYYIKYMSMWLDLQILFDTLRTVMFRQGAQVSPFHDLAEDTEH
jgi:exopolysaccharide biosynthesis polyprenyl glycosylphosphotransferase